MADQVIGYFQDMAAYVLETHAQLAQPPHPEVQQEVLRRAVLPGNAAEKPEICLLDERFKALAVGGHVRISIPIPPCSACPRFYITPFLIYAKY